MIAHVVLMRPKPNLSSEDRQAFLESFRRAIREIPSVRGVRVGRRVRIGAAYESRSPDTGEFLAVIDFDDLAGLESYLQHAAHHELGARFYQSLESALVYDYRVGGVELLEEF